MDSGYRLAGYGLKLHLIEFPHRRPTKVQAGVGQGHGRAAQASAAAGTQRGTQEATHCQALAA